MKWLMRIVNYSRIIHQFEVCDCHCSKLFPKQRDRHFVRHFAVACWWQSRGESVEHSKALTSVEIMHTQESEPTGESSIVATQTHSSLKEDLDETRKKPQFGTRFLTDPRNVFQHNAWDSVVWDEEQEYEARQKTQEQLKYALPDEQQEAFEKEADLFWDKFYSQHQNRFFKDRHWLFTEFPELYSSSGNTNRLVVNTQAGDGCEYGASELAFRVSNGLSVSASQATDVAATDACIAHVSSDVPNLVFSDCEDTKQRSDKSADCAALVSGESNYGDACDKSVKRKAHSSSEKNVTSTDIYPGQSATFRVFEVGCGVGNTVFPILHTNNDPNLMVYCCDFSSTAIQLVKEHRDYDPKRCHAFVWDITDESSLLPFPPASLDIVILIFVLSALHPDKMQQAVIRLVSCLKPGGLILLRDYGRYDMAQLRFKKGRCLAENFYVRGDGTRVYFFTQEEFRNLFKRAGLVEEQNLIDRRLQVNRGRQLKMYRVWIQCKYRKPLTNDHMFSLHQSL